MINKFELWEASSFDNLVCVQLCNGYTFEQGGSKFYTFEMSHDDKAKIVNSSMSGWYEFEYELYKESIKTKRFELVNGKITKLISHKGHKYKN